MNINTNTHVKSQSIHYYILNKTLRFNKRRCESVDKYSMTPFYSLNDRESMIEEMAKLLKEIKVKTKEFKALNHSHFTIEFDNTKLIQTIDGLISECKQIPQPIEKKRSIHKISLNKKRSLYNKFQDKLILYQQELISKDHYLNELKSNDNKILRMYEIESKLINANEQYENIYKKYAESSKKLTKLDQQSQKVIEESNILIANNIKLEKEKNDLIEKIRLNEMDNRELSQKEQFFEETISSIINKLGVLKIKLKEKNETWKFLKDKMIDFQYIVSVKEKSDGMITSQMKQIQILKEKIDKKNKILQELELIQTEYFDKIQLLKSSSQVIDQSLSLIQKEKLARDDEYIYLQNQNKLIKETKQKLLERLQPSHFAITKQLCYSINIPLKIELD